MSDLNQAQWQNLSVVDDAPPTQPQGLPETATLQNVHDAEKLLLLSAGDQAVHQLYAHFNVKCADDLAETDRREFIGLANMDSDDRARFVGSKQSADEVPAALTADSI